MAESVYIEIPPECKENECMATIPFSQVDCIIKDDDLLLVKTYLKRYAVQWDGIGLNLNIPKYELDIIKEDNTITDRKLVAMIDFWLKRGENCTWRALFNAVRSLHQIKTVTIDVNERSEIVIKEEKPQDESSDDFWVRKQRVIREQGATMHFFWQYVYRAYKNTLSDLRTHVGVASHIDEEIFLKNSRLYCFCFRKELLEIILAFPNECIYLEVWENLLKRNIDTIYDETNALQLQEDNFKEGEIKNNTKRYCQKSLQSCSPEKGNPEDLKVVKELLVQEIHTCLESVNISFDKAKNLKNATTSFILGEKEMFIENYIMLALFFQIYFALKQANVPQAVMYSLISILIYPCFWLCMGFIIGIVGRCLKLNPSIPFPTYEVFTLFNKLHKNLIKKYVVVHLILLVSLSTSVLEIIIYQFEAKPIKPKQLTTSIIKALYTIINYAIVYSHVIQDLLVGTLMVFLGAKVVSYLRHQMGRKLTVLAAGTVYFALFILICQFMVTHMLWMLLGISVSAVICALHFTNCSILTKANMFRLFGLLLINIIFLVFISMGEFIGHLISHHTIIRIISTAAGGSIGAVCTLCLTRKTKFPSYSSHYSLRKYTSTLNESIHKLKGLKNNVEDLLHQSKALK